MMKPIPVKARYMRVTVHVSGSKSIETIEIYHSKEEPTLTLSEPPKASYLEHFVSYICMSSFGFCVGWLIYTSKGII